MGRSFLTRMILVFVLCAFSLQALAQAPAPAPVAPPVGEEKAKSSGGPRKQLATILFAGLSGAILGLSTLSFYGRPQDKLSNIAIGFAFGVIIGTSYVTFQAATNPSEFYSLVPEQERIVQWQSVREVAQPDVRATAWTWTF